MNVNNVYLCKICMITEMNYDIKRDSLEVFGSFVKDTIVVPVGKCLYRDLLTGEKYYVGTSFFRDDIGTFYIYRKERLIPFTEIIPVEKNNMSKRKILKKYNEYQYQNQTKEKE